MATTRSTSTKTTKKPVAGKKATTTTRKSPKKPAARKQAALPVSTKVDYYPNRMTVAVSALAGTMLVLLAVIAALGSR